MTQIESVRVEGGRVGNLLKGAYVRMVTLESFTRARDFLLEVLST